MRTAEICFFILGGVLLLIAGFYFAVYTVFEKFPQKTDKTFGRLYDSKYKNDVAVWGGLGKGDGPPRIVFTIKHLTKTKYVYRVGDKLYLCTFAFWRKPSKVPSCCRVVYIKNFPRISYLDSDENYFDGMDYFMRALMILFIALGAIGLGLALF